MHKLKRLKWGFLPHRVATAETIATYLLCFIVFTAQASAVVRFTDRSLLINNSEPGVVTTYTVTMHYTTLTAIGSVDMLFCTDPIPTDPCNPPAGVNASNAVLSDQTGETGYTISTHTPDHLVLSRVTPAVVGNEESKYVFTGITNPTDMSHSFSIRLSDYASTDASGTLIDLGSVVTEINNSIVLETQIPPMLIFCLAQQVSSNCATTDGGNNSDLGTLDPGQTLKAQSQMAVGTNASQGFAITANGTTMESGTNTIAPISTPSPSVPGTNQFGINLVANTDPLVGKNPDGDSTNAVVTNNYSQPNKYQYKDGDVVAGSPNVSLVRRFTMSYIVNVSPSLPAGVYTTTLTFICSGRF